MANKVQKPRFSVAITTPAYQNMIRSTLSDPERASRFIASITSAVAVNPALQECEASTILAGSLLGESLGLSPSPQLGQYYLIPFKAKAKYDQQGNMISPEVTNAQFVLGYKGYIQLALRSGYYADLDVMEIKEGEYRGKDKNTGKPTFEFIEDDDIRDTLPVVGYMAYFEYLNGFRKVLYWSKKKMMKHADQYSPAFSAEAVINKKKPQYSKVSFADYEAGKVAAKDMWLYSSFWYKDFDGMAKKTMLRQLISKWGVMSIDLQNAIVKDHNFIDLNENKDGFFETPETSDMVPIGDGSQPDDTDEPEEETVDLNALEE